MLRGTKSIPKVKGPLSGSTCLLNLMPQCLVGPRESKSAPTDYERIEIRNGHRAALERKKRKGFFAWLSVRDSTPNLHDAVDAITLRANPARYLVAVEFRQPDVDYFQAKLSFLPETAHSLR